MIQKSREPLENKGSRDFCNFFEKPLDISSEPKYN